MGILGNLHHIIRQSFAFFKEATVLVSLVTLLTQISIHCIHIMYVCRLEEKTLVESLLNFVPTWPPVLLRISALSAQVRMMKDNRPKISMVQGSFHHKVSIIRKLSDTGLTFILFIF